MTQERSTSDGPSEATRERRTGRPSREHSEEIERIILEQATALYLQDGPAVTMKAIVKSTGLSSKTIYARYPNKDSLFLAVLRSLIRNASLPMDLDPSSDESISETLRKFAYRTLKGAYEPESVALHRMMSLDPSLNRKVGADMFAMVDRILLGPMVAYLDGILAAGRIRPVDTGMVARALTTVVVAEPASRHAEGKLPPDETEMADRADFIADFFYHGLKK